jgi:cbb3-type cytochrome c oxidase subunit III
MRRGGLLGVALLLAVFFGGGCGTGGLAEGGSAGQGQPLFNDKCGSCHTLRAAATQGKIGPNLDDAFAQARADGVGDSTIREVVRQQIQFPAPADVSVNVQPMPKDLVKGDDADSVAAYVASVAAVEDAPVATPPAPPPPAAGGGGADGKAIFSSSCASCHTLAAAGASGTIGPNLDETKPTLDLAVDRVTNGQGVMPSFKDQLSEEQIQAVAKFVAESAGQ